MRFKLKCTPYIFVATTCFIAFTLSACDAKPKNALAQQQHFICKSLIDGFLKAQHLGQYELQNVHPIIQDAVSERQYIYRVSSDYQIRLTPQQKKLHFQCQHQDPQHYRVQFIHTDSQIVQPLIQLELPPKPIMRQLTAFSLE